ncbi:TonB-dependent receptor domain-containing protein [Dokdonella soli]|uniref:TonB-dependent vitamin B12 receptor n=1 Tax=Dokdonella soli TaxID=529810 RepID=A0ABN1IPX8_9GAMM
MFRYSVLFIAVSAALGGAAHADEVDLQPTVQVTASRVAETVDQTLADVSVITRQDIDTSVARDVLDLMRLEAGIDLYRTGGPGQQTSLFLRGTNSNQVLVLIDGVRTAAATTGAFAFEQLPLDAVERIEIVRGPRASYWGSDAIGGVIQIFTRKLEGPRVALGYGSYRDAEGSAGIGHWDGANGYSVQVGARHVGGFSPTNPGICNGPNDPYCPYDGDDDGYRNTNLAARGAYTLGSQLLSATLYRSQGQVQFDQGYSNVIEQTAGLNLEGELGANWSHRLALGNAREDLNTPAFSTLYLTRRSSLLWQNEIRLDENQRLIAGLDLVHEKGETRDTSSNTPRYRDSRDNRALFGGWRAAFGAFDSELSARHDDNSQFGGATTGSLALGWRVNERLRAYASFGQGFRSPTMNELYDPGYGGYFAGNPNLAPERSHSAELGLEFSPTANQRFKANLYSTRVHDLISFTGPQNRAENIANAKLDGAELSYRVNAGAWSARAAYTWEDARNADTDTPLLRRAKQKVSGTVERSFGERFTAGAELVYAGRRHDIGGVELPAYAIVNLRARYTLSPAWSLSARLENLADRNYELVHGYNTPGRSGFLDIVWQP